MRKVTRWSASTSGETTCGPRPPPPGCAHMELMPTRAHMKNFIAASFGCGQGVYQEDNIICSTAPRHTQAGRYLRSVWFDPNEDGAVPQWWRESCRCNGSRPNSSPP